MHCNIYFQFLNIFFMSTIKLNNVSDDPLHYNTFFFLGPNVHAS